MMENLLAERYGIVNAKVERLRGYDNRNYDVRVERGRYVLKTYPNRPGLTEELLAESEVLRHLRSIGLEGLPAPVPDNGGNLVFRTSLEGRDTIARLLTFVDGELVGEKGLTPDVLRPIGTILARIACSLSDLSFPALTAKKSEWDLQNYRLNADYLKFIRDPSDRKFVDYFFLKAREFVDPKLGDLPRGLIHGDPNEWNIVRTELGVSLIDFGDICHSPLVNDLAIACAYAAMFAEEPVSGVLPLIEGYSESRPLNETECDLLFDLIALRLCVSVCNAARARVEMPDNEYAFLSEENAWSTLRRWVTINPVFARNRFRAAAELPEIDRPDALNDLVERREMTSAALSLQFNEPIRMRSAAFQYMFDEEGRSYLDCYNNIPHVGHCHPRVAEAAARASIKLNTNTRYLTREFNEFAKLLLERFPPRLSKLFLVNSGSAATDLALRLARAHSGNGKVIVAEHGYHGNTAAGIEVSHYKYARKGGPGKSDSVIEAPIPNALRPGDTGRDFFKDLKDMVASQGLNVSAFIAEPIVGCGGQVPLPSGYLEKVYGFVRASGGVCISDEVQTGFGRLGGWFWGFEMQGVEPDIVILGKPIGNGYPIGAVVTTEEIARSFETGMEFFSSFGGNTVACAVGSAVLEVIDSEELQKNADRVGGQLLAGLRRLAGKFDACVDARGAGLFLGLELAEEGDPAMPGTRFAVRIKERLKKNGILVGTDGPFDNVIKIKPPMCFTAENADELVVALEEAIAEG